MNRKLQQLALSLTLIFLTGCTLVETDPPPDQMIPKENKTFSISELRPADDFYGYQNAKELLQMELPETDNSNGTLDIIQKTVDDQIEALILEIANSSHTENVIPGSNEQLIHDLYWLAFNSHSGKHDTSIQDTNFLDSVISEIQAADSMNALFSIWERLCTEYDNKTAVFSYIMPNLENTEEYIIYINTFGGLSLQELLENAFSAAGDRNTMRDLLYAAGMDYDTAKDHATAIEYMLLDIAAGTDFDALEQAESSLHTRFHGYTKQELEQQLHILTYEQLLHLCGLQEYPAERLYFSDPAQFFLIDSLLDESHLQIWKDYTICTLLKDWELVLPPEYGQKNNFDGMTDQDYAIQAVNTLLENQIGEVYTARYFTEQKRQDVTKICQDIIDMYEILIQKADWLTSKGKTALIRKLRRMQLFIGADTPHEIDPADAALIGNSMLETFLHMKKFHFQADIEKIGTPVRVNGFEAMPPQIVNACYVSENNCFNITAAIMNAPLYDETADPAVNLGGIGAIIGHEISHAFDNSGMEYDETGCYHPGWMPEADVQAFQEIMKRTVDYYDKFKVLNTYHVNGQKTLGENLADISGLQCVLSIAGTPDAQKKVFESYANVWEELTLDSYAREQIYEDVHSPAMIRVNAVVSCFDEFYAIYDVQEGDGMYVSPEDRVRRW